MKSFFAFLTLLFFITISAQDKVEKYSKAKIYYNNYFDIEKLLSNGIPVDHGLQKKNVFVESVFSESQLKKAKELGYTVKVEISDMAKYVTQKRKTVKNASPCGAASSDYQTPVNFELGSMGGFYTLSEMLQELDDMHTLYPNLITVKAPISNFQTEEGRNIYFVKISDNPTVDENEPEMLFTGIHHAREPAAMQQLIFYMWYLLENYATDPEIKSIVDNTEQFFVPIVNPDGYHYNEVTNPNGGGYWRKNRRNNGGSYGVDNNRNYSYHWGESGVSGPSGDTYNGTAPFSEIENQAVKWLTEQHQFVMALNNHTYSSLLLYPFGYAYNVPTPDNALYQAISGLMVEKSGYVNEISSDLYPAAGDSDDWMYGDTTTKNKIFAMTPEIGNNFWPAQDQIIGICKDMLYTNITAAHLIENYAKLTLNDDIYISTLNFNVDYSIQRLGIQEPANFIVSVVPVSSNIVSVSNAISHNNMTMLETQNNQFSIQLDPNIAQGDAVVYKVVLNNGLFNKEYLVERIYGTPNTILHINGNNLNQFETNNWGISQSSYYSAPYSLTDSPNSNYNDYENSTLVLQNEIDLTNVNLATISFYAKWDIEKSWDYVQFEISTDNGVSWVPQCGKYTNAGVADQGILGEPMYDGIQNTWVKEEINLSDYIGQHIKFRFQLVSDANTNGDGFYFDELKVEVLNNNSASVSAITNNEFEIYPNPTHNIVFIHAEKETNYHVILTDINGKIIRKIEFDNTDNQLDISNISKGIYFISITSNNDTNTYKIIKN